MKRFLWNIPKLTNYLLEFIVAIIKYIRNNKSFLGFSIIKISTQALALLSNILIVRKMSVEEYGIYSIVIMIIGFVISFGFSWSASSILYFGSTEKDTTGKMHYTLTSRNILIFVNFIFFAFLLLIFDKSLINYIGLDVNSLILISVIVQTILSSFEYYFLAINKQVLSSLLVLSSRLIFIISLLLFEITIESLLLIDIFSILLSFVFLIKIDLADFTKFKYKKDYFNKFFKFSAWQLFGFSGVYLINFGDNWVINYYMSVRDVGIYNAPYKIFTGISQLAYVIVSFYGGRIASYTQQNLSAKLYKFYYRERFIIVPLSIFMHIIIIIFAKEIILLLFGDQYIEAVDVLRILMIGSIFRYIEVFNVIYYNTNNQFKFLQMTNILQAIINLALSFILVKYIGILGAAISTTVAIGIKTLISVVYCEKSIIALCKPGRK